MRVMRVMGLMRLMRPMGLMGLMGLMGCSGEEAADRVVSEEGTPIAFAAAQEQDRTITRGDYQDRTITRSGLQEEGVTAFTVFGFKNMLYDDESGAYGELQRVFPGYNVTWRANSSHTSTTNSSNWEYVIEGSNQTIKYWDWGVAAYRFFGVTGGVNIGTGTYGTQGAYGTYGDEGQYDSYEVTITADGSSDATVASTPFYSHLWFSTGNTGEGYQPFGQPVQLVFLKPLSKVRFMFTFEDPSQAGLTALTEKSFRPTSGATIKTKAKVTVSYPLTGPAEKEWYTIASEAGGIRELTQDYYEATTKETVVALSEEHVVSPYFDAPESPLRKIYSVLPTTGQGTYTLSVNVNGEPKTTVVPAEYMNWEMGYLYTYIFKVHVDGGVEIDMVQSAFTPWTEYFADYTVYNW